MNAFNPTVLENNSTYNDIYVDLNGDGNVDIIISAGDIDGAALSDSQTLQVFNVLSDLAALNTPEANNLLHNLVGRDGAIVIRAGVKNGAPLNSTGEYFGTTVSGLVTLNFERFDFYVNPLGAVVETPLIRVLTHELTHIAMNYIDDPEVDDILGVSPDYQGDIVRSTNDILNEYYNDASGLLWDRVSYFGSVENFLAPAGTSFIFSNSEWSGGSVLGNVLAFEATHESISVSIGGNVFSGVGYDVSLAQINPNTYRNLNDLILARVTTETQIIWAGDGDDYLYGSLGDDQLFGGHGSDYINGHRGIDTAHYDQLDSAGSVAAEGVKISFSNRNVLVDDSVGGIDLLISVEKVSLTAKSDIFSFDGLQTDVQAISGGTVLDAQNPRDTVDGSSSSVGFTINLNTGATTIGNHALSVVEFENVIGSSHQDVITGSSPINGGEGSYINGRAGQDTIYGLGGDDILQGGADADVIDGGAGNDLIFAGQYDAPSIDASGGNSLYGGTGDDILFASAGGDTLNGGAGSDLLISRGGSDTLIGGSASDLIIVEAGSSDSVTIDGGSGDDFIFAGNSSSGSDITVMFGADSGHDYIAAGGSKVDEIVFEGLSGSDVRLFWNYHVVSTEGSLDVPVDFDPYEPTVFLSETEHRAGQAYIQVKSTGATINLGHMEGTYVTNKGVEFYDDAYPGEQDWGFSFTYNTSISMAKELTLTFDDGSFTGGPQDGLPGFPPIYYSLVSSSADDDGTVSDNGLISVDDFIHGSLGNGGGGTAFLESFSNNAIGNSGALLNGETDLDVILSASTIALLEQDIFAV